MPRLNESRGESGRRSSHRRWLAGVLLTLGVAVLAAGVLLAWRLYQRQAAITRLLEFDSSLTGYFHPDAYVYAGPSPIEDSDGVIHLILGRGQTIMGYNVQDEPSTLQRWMVSIVGEQLCTDMVEIYIVDEQFQDADLKLLHHMPCLREFCLSGTRISNEGLREIAERWGSLTVLEIDGTRITDSGLQSLSELKELRKLDVSGTQVTRSATERFRKQHPDCLVLD